MKSRQDDTLSPGRVHGLRIALAPLFILLFLFGCAAGKAQSPPPGNDPRTAGQTAPSSRQVDPAQVQRLQQTMTPLIKAMNHPLPLNEVRIGILDSVDINAANAGGGQFYVTRGLLERANDEELKGALAHEVAHADLGHVTKQKALGTGVSIGSIILDQIIPGSGLITPYVADLGVMKPYSRKEEYQADAHGVEILNKAGQNGKQIMDDTLKWLLQATGPSGGFFATHPGTSDRIQRIEAMR
jgi:Zn-dependent protease with chaperone function